MLCNVTRDVCWRRSAPSLLAVNNPIVGRHGFGSAATSRSRHVLHAGVSVTVTNPSAKELREAAGQLAQVLGAAAQSSSDNQVLDELRHVHSLAERIKTSVDGLENAIKQQTRLQSLRWGLDNLDCVYRLRFIVEPSLGYSGDAKDFVKELLWYAMTDHGIKCGNCMLRYDESEPNKSEKQRAAEFREAIAEEVYSLVGIKPRLKEYPSEGWSMFID